MGFVYVWDIAAEKCLKCERLHEASAGATSNRAALAIRDLSVSQGEVVVSRAAGCDYWLLVRDRASPSDRSGPEAGLGIASPGPGPSPSPSPKPLP